MGTNSLSDLLSGKVVLVTGGTGTVGTALIRRLLQYNPKAIRVFSRDENKQYFMREQFSDVKNMRYFVGDVRDRHRLTRAMEYVDIVFHLAALKHVESCEYNPFEAIQTNIVGTQNVIDVAMDHEIEHVVFSSTDKAVNPANAMGASKLMAEKLMAAANYYKGRRITIFSSVRFGNVLASSGSVVPTFAQRIKNDIPIEVTDPEMTRYVITLDEAVSLLLASLAICRGGEVLVRKMPIIRILDLARVLLAFHGKPADENHLKVVGARAGEKMYEELVTLEESTRTFEIDDFYVIRPLFGRDDVLDPIWRPVDITSYTSNSGPAMSEEEIRNILGDHLKGSEPEKGSNA